MAGTHPYLIKCLHKVTGDARAEILPKVCGHFRMVVDTHLAVEVWLSEHKLRYRRPISFRPACPVSATGWAQLRCVTGLNIIGDIAKLSFGTFNL